MADERYARQRRFATKNRAKGLCYCGKPAYRDCVRCRDCLDYQVWWEKHRRKRRKHV